jgi:hypothetical protein
MNDGQSEEEEEAQDNAARYGEGDDMTAASAHCHRHHSLLDNTSEIR